MAGVEPKFERRELNGGEVRALVVSLNLARRNLKAGQKAMAMALLYPEPEKGGRGKKSQVLNSAETAGFSSRRLNEARAVYAHSRALAEDVLKDTVPLDESLAVATLMRILLRIAN